MNRQALITYILDYIKQNGIKYITGPILADVLVKIVVNMLNSTDDPVQVANVSTRVTKPGTIVQDQEDQYAFTLAGWEWEIEGTAYAQASSQNFQIEPITEEGMFRNDLFVLPKANAIAVVQGDVLEIPQPQTLFNTADDIAITAISVSYTGVVFDNAANTHKQNTDTSLANGLVTATELRAFLDAGRYSNQEAIAAIYNAWVDDPNGIQLVYNEETQSLSAFLPPNVVRSVNGVEPDENGNVEVAGSGGTSEPPVSAVRTVASNPAIGANETDLPYDCSAAQITVSLAVLAKRNGREVTYYKVDSVNNLVLTGAGYNNSTDTLTDVNERITYKCDGTLWLKK